MEQYLKRSNFLPLVLVASLLVALVFGTAAAAGRQDPAPAPQRSEDGGKHLAKAREAYDAGKYSAAKRELKQALAAHKEYPEASLLLGMTYWQEGNKKDAIAQISNAIRYRPGYAEAHYHLAIIFWKTRDVGKARQEVDAAIRHDASSSASHYLSGQIYLTEGKRSEALVSFEETARLLTVNHPSREMLQKQIDALKQLIAARTLAKDPTYIAPGLTNNPVPSYSDEARDKGIQGTVSLAIEVYRNGWVTSAIVLLGLGYGLDEQAGKAAKQLKFKPATRNGTPLAVWKAVIIEFNLRRRF